MALAMAYFSSLSSAVRLGGLRNLNSEKQTRAAKLPVRLPNCSGSKIAFGHLGNGLGFRAKASYNCIFDPDDEPILKEAFKEPVAFMGGMFAGLLRLDLNEEPLKEWVTRTVEASGIAEDIDADDLKADDKVPQQIEIS
uniref:UPF0426 protein At1g28150ic n=1 Tax=Rhizophora mucronata TaxID=61149 RepID=A0A2P2P0F7_RHIMU